MKYPLKRSMGSQKIVKGLDSRKTHAISRGEKLPLLNLHGRLEGIELVPRRVEMRLLTRSLP
jgi:hypothetical protein